MTFAETIPIDTKGFQRHHRHYAARAAYVKQAGIANDALSLFSAPAPRERSPPLNTDRRPAGFAGSAGKNRPVGCFLSPRGWGDGNGFFPCHAALMRLFAFDSGHRRKADFGHGGRLSSLILTTAPENAISSCRSSGSKSVLSSPY